tara:strand:+ start:3666 stop:4556 length:891 start_codon:yes stop_codon:yes gene_type:complete
MLMSMTGYGKREIQNNDILLSLEIKSINSRYLEVNHKIPRLFFEDEDNILNVIRKKLLRGKIIININYQILNDSLNKISLDETKLDQYLKIINDLSRRENIDSKITINKILSFPDIINSSSAPSNVSYKRVLSRCLNDAINDLISMRKQEGENLTNDIKRRLNKIKKYLNSIIKNTKQSKKETLNNYKKKIKSIINDKDKKIILDDNRLLHEIVIIMEKKDIHEEITRLQSHIKIFEAYINKGNVEKGKRMTFLLQEFLREANTISSKTDNVKNSHIVVNVKTEIEKIREQIQNIL